MPYVKSLRDIVISSVNGHTVRVTALKATFVPAILLSEALDRGCVECDENGKLLMDLSAVENLPVDEVPKLTDEERQDPEQRASALIQAVAKLYAESDPKKFNANKLPKVRAVEALVGFPTSAGEVEQAIERYHAGG